MSLPPSLGYLREIRIFFRLFSYSIFVGSLFIIMRVFLVGVYRIYLYIIISHGKRYRGSLGTRDEVVSYLVLTSHLLFSIIWVLVISL